MNDERYMRPFFRKIHRRLTGIIYISDKYYHQPLCPDYAKRVLVWYDSFPVVTEPATEGGPWHRPKLVRREVAVDE